ncbi:MAG: alpha/beta fold hydrolase [Actinomycetota bacterium]
MSAQRAHSALNPPDGIAGLDPAWSRLVTVADHRDDDRTWHLLDSAPPTPRVTLVCVHGNPTWSYLWRDLVGGAPDDVRVIAVDQLEMGWSERTELRRGLGARIEDLSRLIDALVPTGPVITVGHDWGGPISLGLALHLHERGRLDGVVLANTAVHHPAGSPAPTLIRAARLRGVLAGVTSSTTTFVHGALALSRPRPPAEVRAGYRAPYGSADRREGIEAFVEDIPLDDAHPSRPALDDLAARMTELAAVPALLLWGTADPVFGEAYLHDLEARLPEADVHRFVGAGHLTPEDADVAGAVLDWIERPPASPPAPPSDRPRLWDPIGAADPDRVAVVELGGGSQRAITFGELDRRVGDVAAGLAATGVRPGDRVALMIPPGVDLTVVLYACWRLGSVMVLVDSGLGPRNMSRALASAAPDHLIGIAKAMAAGRALRWPGRRIVAGPMGGAARRALGVELALDEVEALGDGTPPPIVPPSSLPAAIAFTSGSTGPSKGVAYRHHQIEAQVEQIRSLASIGGDDRFVAAFAPFALYGPALGITSVVPDMDVTRPGTLDAAALAAAARAVDATLVFASPAALANVVASGATLPDDDRAALGRVRLLLSAGAPVNPELLGAAAALLGDAEARTPYGMTECLPVADVSLDEVREATGGDGVCVGRPREGVDVAVSPLDERGRSGAPLTTAAGVVGEVVVRAAHVKDRYDRLWWTEHRSSWPPDGHRTGDVGMLDARGRLWIGGRMEHVLTTAAGPVTPVAIELASESVADVVRAAAVGVGPLGAQVVVVVAETADAPRRGGLAPLGLADEVRSAVWAAREVDVAAVLTVPALPVDRRHNSKIDRRRVGDWAAEVLAGGRWRAL